MSVAASKTISSEMTIGSPALTEFSPVSILFGSGSPIAVFRRVVSVVVTPLKHHFRVWLESYVIQEALEIISPCFAHFDPSSPIARIIAILRVLASSDHRAPCVVLDLSRPAVRDGSSQSQFPIKASTGASRRNFTPKSCLVKRAFLAAVTPAQPSPQFLSRLNFADHDEPSVPLPNKIDHGQNCTRGHWRVSLL